MPERFGRLGGYVSFQSRSGSFFQCAVLTSIKLVRISMVTRMTLCFGDLSIGELSFLKLALVVLKGVLEGSLLTLGKPISHSRQSSGAI
jgi:hypothetical protein